VSTEENGGAGGNVGEKGGRAGTSVSLTETRAGLAQWLQRRWPQASVQKLSSPSANGFSNETIFVEWSDGPTARRSVLRLASARPSIFPDGDIRLQHDLLDIMGDLGLRVPRAEGFEDDPRWVGAPFFLMERVDGEVPGDDPPYTRSGWLFDLEPTQRAIAHRHAADALMSVADVPVDQLRTRLAERGHHLREGLDAELDYYERYLDWASPERPQDELRSTLAWLRQGSRHHGDRLVWGDARIGNIVFGDDLDVAAILDWDMVLIGPAELDLGWWLFHQRYFSEGIKTELPAGLLTRDDMLRLWEERNGPVEDPGYWEVFGGFRLALFVLRGMSLLVDAGVLPPEKQFGDNHRVMRTLRRLRSSMTTITP
jgi:aminoglycoside phosphotransferase (APT) family kinase protein